jgi:hypothetical protein
MLTPGLYFNSGSSKYPKVESIYQPLTLYFMVTPSPFIPLPLIKGKGEEFLRGAAPLFDTPLV